MLSHSWCFISAFPEPFVLPVTVLNLQTMAVIMTVVGVYSVRLLFGFSLDLCGVSFSSSGPWLECLNGSLSLSGWLRGEPWWPGSGVLAVLRHLPQRRVWKDGGATETQSSARCRAGKQTYQSFSCQEKKHGSSKKSIISAFNHWSSLCCHLINVPQCLLKQHYLTFTAILENLVDIWVSSVGCQILRLWVAVVSEPPTKSINIWCRGDETQQSTI